MKAIISASIEKGLSYEAYRSLIDELLAQDKTTGPNQSEAFVHYTQMNASRMKRIDKTTKVQEESRASVEAIDRPQTWLVITEGWCGDAAQIIPVIDKLASLNPKVTTRYVLRDENPALMDLFLTNGGRSIPMIIIVDEETQEVLGKWGPRPSEMQQIVMDRKNDPNASPYSEFVYEAQKWYAKDKTRSIQQEFTAMLNLVAVS
ncbi:MAG: thioredoxin family protein [Bacteroidota bacterium]